MKILLIADKLDGWSANNRCKAIQKFGTGDGYQFDITYGVNNKIDPINLVDQYDILHWNYTGALTHRHHAIMEYRRKMIITIINERSLLNGVECDIPKMEEMMRSVAATTSVNKKIADMYNVEYIPNGIDFDLFAEPRPFVVGYVGSNRPNKNNQLLQRCCDNLGIKLHKACYKENQVAHEDMWREYHKIDVFVHPSFTEGCSNPVLEALAMNVPVIMTREGIWHEFEGMVEYIEPTEESITAALSRRLTRKVIQERFNWSDIVERYKKVYDRVYAAL
jgi:glycosyltransferase involved in cell wall biosynthesis